MTSLKSNRFDMLKPARGVFINTAKASCSIFESGRMVYNCISESDHYTLDYFSLDMIDVSLLATKGQIKRLDDPESVGSQLTNGYDFWVFNWHFVTMAPFLDPPSIGRLPGPKFTVVLELEPNDPLKLAPPDVFDGYIALDPTVAATSKIFPFPRPLEGEPYKGPPKVSQIPIIGSFGFGTPGKGFELLVEAVNREFSQAVIRINVPRGTYTTSTDCIHGREYEKHIASLCKKIAKPGIEVEFTHDFMSEEQLIVWCASNDLNCFMYTRRQPGLSATTDQAIISGRPLLTISNDTFRHIHRYIPPYPLLSLRRAMETTIPLVQTMQRDWSRKTFNETFHRMLGAFGLIAGEAVDGTASAVAGSPQAYIMLASRGAAQLNDILNYGTRLAECLGRSGSYVFQQVNYETEAELTDHAAKLEPDAVILLGSAAREIKALSIALKGVAGPKLVLANDTDSHSDGSLAFEADVIVLPKKPIIPFHTTFVGLRAGPPSVWLIGFAAIGSNLEDLIEKLGRETPAAHVFLEVPTHARAEFESRVATLRERQPRDRSLNLSIHTLPSLGSEIITSLAESHLSVFFRDTERSEVLENISSLAMTTERAVAFTRSAPFECYSAGVTFIEDFPVPQIIDMGMAAQIELCHDFGEWQTFANIEQVLRKRITRRRRVLKAQPAAPSPVPRAQTADKSGYRATDANHLLAAKGLQFIECAYLTLLGRKADISGRSMYLAHLNGGMPKIEIADALWQSPEGRKFNADVRGLSTAIRAHRLSKRPISRMMWRLLSRREVGNRSSTGAAVVSTADLLLLRDEEFVHAAYSSVLGRAPDADGLRNYMTHLREGASRRWVLGALRSSEEGRNHGAEFVGLAAAARYYRILEFPVIGSLIKLAGGAFNPPANAASPLPPAVVPNAPRAVLTLAGDKAHAMTVATGRTSGATIFFVIGSSESDGPSYLAIRFGQELSRPGKSIRFVLWDTTLSKFQLLSEAELEYWGLPNELSTRSAIGAGEGNQRSNIEPESCGAGDWILFPEMIHANPEQTPLIEMRSIMEAKRLGVLTAFVFAEPRALHSQAYQGGAAAQHERYMQALLQADAIIAKSDLAREDLLKFLVVYQKADCVPAITKISPPQSFGDGRSLWPSYVDSVWDFLGDITQRSSSVTGLYYWIEPALDHGPAVFSQTLAQALRRRGIALIPVTWDRVCNRVITVELGLLNSRADADESIIWADWRDPSETGAPRWLLFPASSQYLSAATISAKSLGLRTTIIIQDSVLQTGDEQDIFEPLSNMDKVFAGSEQNYKALYGLMLSSRRRLHSAEHRFKWISVPNERRPDIRSWDEYAASIALELATDRLSDALRAAPVSAGSASYSEFKNLSRRPKLSICISTFNRAGWLELSLRNIFSQIPKVRDDIEVLVVDNTSVDRTPEVVEPFLARSDFQYVRNPRNVGMLGNLAVTAQRAKGEYIWIIGDDDLTRPGAIERILRVLIRYPGIALVYLNYGYSSEQEPEKIGDLAEYLDKYNVLEPAGRDEFSTVKGLAAKSENFYTAIYSHVYRRDHALKSYCQNTSGRIFSTMLTCIPTAYYVLNYMADEAAYWIGEPMLVVNSNVSWQEYGALFDLEQLPRAWDLAERVGTDPNEVDRRRSNRLWLVELMWKEMFENDKAGNSYFFSAPRVLVRLKHLPEFEKYVPSLRAIYERARAAGHPGASMPATELFSAFS